MNYSDTLEAAGAEVLEYNTFGDYQGTWLALVRYNGEFGIVEGSYGSCSGCDTLQAEFGWNEELITEEEGKYYKGNSSWDPENEITKEEAEELNKNFNNKVCLFGGNYLRDIQDRSMISTRLEIINNKLKEDEDAYFDKEEKEYLEWALQTIDKHS